MSSQAGKKEARVVGQTKDVGFQVGFRKTMAASPQEAWQLITSTQGVKLWLGDVPELRFKKGERYQTKEGVQGEIRVVNPGGHLRLTWKPADWQKASTLQVRVIPRGDKTTISFHQEHLQGPQERQQMKQRWQGALEALQATLER
jgi:uncharacterized protein YndB with AHSA1/START domain